jgi:biuret amidohydrolase
MRSYINGELMRLGDEFVPFFDHAHAAVISIDLHRGHLEDDPDCPCPAPRARAIVPAVNAFHEKARTLGVPVIHVRSILRKGGVDDVLGQKSAWRLVFPLHVGAIGNSDAHAIEGTRWTEFVTDVADDDLIVQTKKRLSAFYPSDLDFLLRNLGIKNVILNGCLTDCCVLNTAFEASNLGYRTVVARDLAAGTNAELEEAALRIIAMHVGLVTDSTEILSAWQANASSPLSALAAV